MGGAGVGVADKQRSLGSVGESAGSSTGGEERSSTAVSGNALMEAIDITTNGRSSLSLSLSLSLLSYISCETTPDTVLILQI